MSAGTLGDRVTFQRRVVTNVGGVGQETWPDLPPARYPAYVVSAGGPAGGRHRRQRADADGAPLHGAVSVRGDVTTDDRCVYHHPCRRSAAGDPRAWRNPTTRAGSDLEAHRGAVRETLGAHRSTSPTRWPTWTPSIRRCRRRCSRSSRARAQTYAAARTGADAGRDAEEARRAAALDGLATARPSIRCGCMSPTSGRMRTWRPRAGRTSAANRSRPSCRGFPTRCASASGWWTTIAAARAGQFPGAAAGAAGAPVSLTPSHGRGRCAERGRGWC